MVFKITPKLEIAIKVICIIILLWINIVIIGNGVNLSCDNCKVMINEKIPGSIQAHTINITLNEIYENLKEGKCIRWLG